jgi:hypothetical protein
LDTISQKHRRQLIADGTSQPFLTIAQLAEKAGCPTGIGALPLITQGFKEKNITVEALKGAKDALYDELNENKDVVKLATVVARATELQNILSEKTGYNKGNKHFTGQDAKDFTAVVTQVTTKGKFYDRLAAKRAALSDKTIKGYINWTLGFALGSCVARNAAAAKMVADVKSKKLKRTAALQGLTALKESGIVYGADSRIWTNEFRHWLIQIILAA